jgi:hypothetical protein
MVGLAGVGEQPGVHPRVQCLDPALEAFGEAGEVLDPRDRQPERRDERGRPAGGDELDARLVKAADEVLEAALVEDRDEGPAHRPDVLRGPGGADLDAAHGMVTFLPLTVNPDRASRPTTSTSIARSRTLMRSWSESTVSSGSTATACCSMIGPVSTPASTK